MKKNKVSDYSEQIRGVSYKPDDLHDGLNENSMILLRANNISDGEINLEDIVYVDKSKVSEKQLLRKGDILVCASSGSKHLVGKAAQVEFNGNYTFGAFCKVVRPVKINSCYLGMYFQSSEYRKVISSISQGANINNIKNENIDNLLIKVPDESKQINVAEILTKVSKIIKLKRQQLDLLDELIKSRFVEMFGDPVHNPFGWNIKPFLECGNCKNGMNFGAGETGVELQYLGVGDFKNLTKIEEVTKLGKVSLNKMPSEDYMLKNGDIVFVRSNGNKALVGRCLTVYPNGVPTTYSGFCIRYRNTDESLEIPYLLQVLKTESMRLMMAGRGANIQNLNQQILGQLQIPIPPNDLQREFGQFIEQVDKLKVEVQKSLNETQLLFDSLMQKYYE